MNATNRPPRGPRPIRAGQQGQHRLRVDGVDLVTRPMTPDDAQGVREMHERCSPESLRLRYFGPAPRLSDAVMRLFTDPERGVTLVTHVAGEPGKVVAMTNLMDLAPGEAEVALLVEDRWQGRGLGRVLLWHALALAPSRRVRVVTASVYATNTRMLSLLDGAGAEKPSMTGMVLDVRLPLAGQRGNVRWAVSLNTRRTDGPSL
ncbi:GNAT family N-acetyltransferase [Herbidospora yilanensis]|uniref:GNAT family N-acetyltransferase n=1 Tax=Herbidospora yilanensis TaxID=354426 RepID=UPI000782CA13|nr:GNAT family N-acetyltransferase [Herbidospora yilanensis]